MERIKVTKAEVTQALIDAVAEMGEDFVYVNEAGLSGESGGCYYVHTEGEAPLPGCLVGNALHRLGVPLDELIKHELESAHKVAEAVLNIEGEATQVQRMLRDAQDAQDSGHTWGFALLTAGVVAAPVD